MNCDKPPPHSLHPGEVAILQSMTVIVANHFEKVVKLVIHTWRAWAICSLIDGPAFSACCRLHNAVIVVSLCIRATDWLKLSRAIQVFTAHTFRAISIAVENALLPRFTLLAFAEICGFDN